MTQGLALSLGVYAASYQGWVPVLRTLPTATRDSKDRQTVLVVSHLVSGAAPGALGARSRSLPAIP